MHFLGFDVFFVQFLEHLFFSSTKMVRLIEWLKDRIFTISVPYYLIHDFETTRKTNKQQKRYEYSNAIFQDLQILCALILNLTSIEYY